MVTVLMALSRPEILVGSLALGFIVLGIGYGSDFFKIKTSNGYWNIQPILNTFGVCVVIFIALAWMIFFGGDVECHRLISRFC